MCCVCCRLPRRWPETPADFDAFWAKAKAEVEKVPLDPEMIRIDSRSTESLDVYAVSFATLGKDRRVYGVLSIPKRKTRRKFPHSVFDDVYLETYRWPSCTPSCS